MNTPSPLAEHSGPLTQALACASCSQESRALFANDIGFAFERRSIEVCGSRSAFIKQIACGALLLFSFVPISFEAIPYGDLNLSRIPVFVLCALIFLYYFARLGAPISASLLLTFSLSVCQAIGIEHSPAAQKTFLMPMFFLSSMLIAPAVMLLARSFPPSSLDRLVSRVIGWILAFLVFECITRLIFSPHMPVTSAYDFSDRFYLYKFSLFFYDSNFVGLEILCLLAVMFSFRDLVGRRQWVLAYMLLFASLSRASITAAICQFAIYKLWRWRARTVLVLLASAVLIMVKLFNDYMTPGTDLTDTIDGSLITKFMLLNLMTELYQVSDLLQKLCGVGAGNFVNLTGSLSAHTIVAIFTIELGFAGSILFLLYAWVLSRRCPVCCYLLILPMLINGISLVSAAAMPFFFAALGLLGALRGSPRDGSAKLWNQQADAVPPKG